MNKKNLKKIIPLTLLMASLNVGFSNNIGMVHAQTLGDDIPVVAEFKDTTLVDTLDALSRLTDIPIVIHGDLTDKVTLNANGQSLSAILDNLAKTFDLSYEIKDDMILVSKKDVMKTTRTFKLNYLDLDELKSDLKTFMDADNISVSSVDNSVTVSGSASDIKKTEELIRQKDVQQKQVTIQAKLIELSKADEEKLGMTYGWNSFDSTTTWKFAYTAALTANGTDGTGKVLARPTISTINGKEAIVNLADKVPILTTTTSNNDKTTTVDYKDVGVTLKVTPRINENTGYVTMSVNPIVSTITKTIETNNVYAPQISTREVTTNLRVKSGETIIIAGLLKEDDLVNISKIPGLGDLPLLGKLFQNKTHTKEKTELIVEITPIIEGMEDNSTVSSEKDFHNIHNKETIEHMEHTDRRGEDNRKTGRL